MTRLFLLVLLMLSASCSHQTKPVTLTLTKTKVVTIPASMLPRPKQIESSDLKYWRLVTMHKSVTNSFFNAKFTSVGMLSKCNTFMIRHLQKQTPPKRGVVFRVVPVVYLFTLQRSQSSFDSVTTTSLKCCFHK